MEGRSTGCDGIVALRVDTRGGRVYSSRSNFGVDDMSYADIEAQATERGDHEDMEAKRAYIWSRVKSDIHNGEIGGLLALDMIIESYLSKMSDAQLNDLYRDAKEYE